MSCWRGCAPGLRPFSPSGPAEQLRPVSTERASWVDDARFGTGATERAAWRDEQHQPSRIVGISIRAVLLEVYPADLWKKWAGHALPKKQSSEGRRARWDLLRDQGLELPVGPGEITHDQLDAAAAALAAYLWATGRTNAWGEPPSWDEAAGVLREGLIVSL